MTLAKASARRKHKRKLDKPPRETRVDKDSGADVVAAKERIGNLPYESSVDSFHDADDGTEEALPQVTVHGHAVRDGNNAKSAISSDEGEFDDFQEAPTPHPSSKTRKEWLQELRHLIKLPDPAPLEDPVRIMEQCRRDITALCVEYPPSSRRWSTALPDFKKILRELESTSK